MHTNVYKCREDKDKDKDKDKDEDEDKDEEENVNNVGGADSRTVTEDRLLFCTATA